MDRPYGDEGKRETRGKPGVNGPNLVCEGTECELGIVAAEMSEQDRRRCGWGKDRGLSVESSAREALSRGTV